MNNIIDKIMDLMDQAPWITSSIAHYAITHGIDIIAYEQIENSRC